MTDLIDEVKNENQQNRTVTIFKIFLYVSLALLLVVIVAMTIYNAHQDDIRSKNMELSAILLKSKETGEMFNIDLPELYQLLPKYKTSELMALKSLSNKLAQDDLKQAEQILNNILAHKAINPITRSYALLMYSSYCLNLKHLDAEQKSKVSSYTAQITEQDPLYHYSQLLTALWHIKDGDAQLARDLLTRNISSPNCSNKLKRYAQMILLSVDKLTAHFRYYQYANTYLS